MNPIHLRSINGTVGELLVQLRLLEFGVQAAPPLRDTGNDLIAIRGDIFRAISVRTTTSNDYIRPDARRIFHLLAVVSLKKVNETENRLDESRVFLIPKSQAEKLPNKVSALGEYELNQAVIDRCFEPPVTISKFVSALRRAGVLPDEESEEPTVSV